MQDGRGHAYPLPLHHGQKTEPSDVYVRALCRALTVLSTCQERLSARVQALEETLGQDLKGRIEGTTEEVRQELTEALSGLGDALEQLKAKLEGHGDALAHGHELVDPLLNRLQGFLDPLRHGIDSVREGAQRVGLPF